MLYLLLRSVMVLMYCQGFVVCGLTVVNQYSRLVHFRSQKYVTKCNVNVHITELQIHNPFMVHNP